MVFAEAPARLTVILGSMAGPATQALFLRNTGMYLLGLLLLRNAATLLCSKTCFWQGRSLPSKEGSCLGDSKQLWEFLDEQTIPWHPLQGPRILHTRWMSVRVMHGAASICCDGEQEPGTHSMLPQAVASGSEFPEAVWSRISKHFTLCEWARCAGTCKTSWRLMLPQIALTFDPSVPGECRRREKERLRNKVALYGLSVL